MKSISDDYDHIAGSAPAYLDGLPMAAFVPSGDGIFNSYGDTPEHQQPWYAPLDRDMKGWYTR